MYKRQVQRTGQPGADGSDFYIRGISTMNGATNPLIILDGVETVSYTHLDVYKRQGLYKGHKPKLPASASRRWLSLRSSLLPLPLLPPLKGRS